MNRRMALTVIGGLAAPSTWASAQYPGNPYQGGVDYRVLDLATVREVIVRLPKGNITVTTEQIWEALQEK